LRNKTKGKSRKCVKIWRKAIEEGVGEEEIGPLNISRFSVVCGAFDGQTR